MEKKKLHVNSATWPYLAKVLILIYISVSSILEERVSGAVDELPIVMLALFASCSMVKVSK